MVPATMRLYRASPCGPVWPCVALCGPVWPCLALSGPVAGGRARPKRTVVEAGRGSGQPGARCGAEHERRLRSASWPRSEPPLVCTSTTPLLPLTCARAGAKGELKATLCFILPEEKMFSSYYGITCHAR